MPGITYKVEITATAEAQLDHIIYYDPDLAKYGYRVIKFRKHHYYMAYRLKGNVATVDGIYHTMQNFARDLLSKI